MLQEFFIAMLSADMLSVVASFHQENLSEGERSVLLTSSLRLDVLHFSRESLPKGIAQYSWLREEADLN
jgi:hypothetical protein